MILDQLLTSIDDPNPQQKANLLTLVVKLTLLENAYGEPLVPNNGKVNSGFRSWNDQVRIYKAKNDALIKAGKDQVPVPLHSSHLDGLAADLPDPDGLLQSFIIFQTEKVLDSFGLYYESFRWTKGYVHAQGNPPASKKRFYLPYG